MRLRAFVAGEVTWLSEQTRSLIIEFLPEMFPLSLLLSHEPHKFRIIADAIKKRVMRKQRIVWEACHRGFFQPFHCFVAIPSQRVNTCRTIGRLGPCFIV